MIGKITDLVNDPRNKMAISELIPSCNEQRLPIYVYGGGN